jgi:hypothetical protein
VVNSTRARSVAAYVVLAAAFGVLAVQAALPLHNTDTYFHLRFGHEFLTGHWSLRHPGSVTTLATADWVPTQWLPEVVMAQLEEWFGLPGVAWLSGLLFLTLALAVYWACRRQSEPLVAAALACLTLITCSTGLSMRPQMISYLLVAVTAASWLCARETGRVPWLLVPLSWAWTLCHGMWPIGILIGLVAVLGLVADRGHPRGLMVRMAAVPLLSAAVSLLTPVGPGLFPAVLRVSSRSRYFYEWDPPDFTRPIVATLLVLLALAVVPRLRRTERVPWFDISLIALATLWGVYSQRTVPVAACLVAPLAALALQPGLGAAPLVRRTERLVVLGGYAVAMAALAVVVPHTADQPRDTPPWVDAALGDLPPGTVVLNESGFGGYLMWRFPQLDLVANGYGDTYTDDELERNADIWAVRAGWLEDVRDTHAEYAILPPGSPLAYNLRQIEHWSVVDQGDDLQLLAPPPGWVGS